MALLQKNGNGNYIHLFWRCCCKESDNINVVALFYGGGVVKKVMAIDGFVFCFLFFVFFFSPFGFVH
jgi:hypothetical protein